MNLQVIRLYKLIIYYKMTRSIKFSPHMWNSSYNNYVQQKNIFNLNSYKINRNISYEKKLMQFKSTRNMINSDNINLAAMILMIAS